MVDVTRGQRTTRDPNVVTAMLAPATSHGGWVTITPVTRPDLAVRCEMTTGVTRSGVGAVWEDVTRPMRSTVAEYVGQQLERQAFTVLFEGEPAGDGEEPASVQPQVAALLALLLPLPGEYTPPVLNLDGPVQGRRGAQQWQLQSAEQNGEALRRAAEGYVWSVSYDVTFALWTSIAVVSNTPPPSPAAAADAAAAAAAPGGPPRAGGPARTYTVRKGDTLSRIAQQQLGAASRWRELATLNGLADPNRVFPGQVIRLP